MLRPNLFAAACVSLTCLVTSAANKPDKADRIVDEVLKQEIRGSVMSRGNDLGDLVEQSDRARWAAGYVRAADGWKEFSTIPTVDDRFREYEQRRGTEPLTPVQHLQLANWCRDQKLHEQERAHLWASVSNAPNPGEIYRRLGYTNVDGEWMTAREQQVLSHRQQQREKDFRTWTPRAQKIRGQLSQTEPGAQAIGRAELREISDSRATAALEASLSNTSPELTAEFVTWCKQVRSIDTTLALARQSILSPWESSRTLAADALRNRPMAHYVPPLLSVAAKPTEARLVRTSTQLSRGNVVLAYQFQRETWQTVENGTYFVRSNGTRRVPDGGGRIANRTRRARTLTDLDREIRDEIDRRETQVATQNQAQQELNDRISHSLSVAARVDSKSTPEELWNWWHQETATAPVATADKQTTSVIEVEELPPQLEFEEPARSCECLTAGTVISTSRGPRAVETLQLGDVVLAKDIETGELAYKPVLRTTVRTPQPIMTLHTKEDSIRSTLGHHFWVSGQGWRMAKEIKPGDRLHGVQGTVTVTDVSRGGREAVYNLVVEGANSYFVGEGKILSHDVTPPVPTDIVVPGLAGR